MSCNKAPTSSVPTIQTPKPSQNNGTSFQEEEKVKEVLTINKYHLPLPLASAVTACSDTVGSGLEDRSFQFLAMAMIDSKLRLGFGERERKGKISGYGVKLSGSGLNWKIIALLRFLFPEIALWMKLLLCWIFDVLKLQR